MAHSLPALNTSAGGNALRQRRPSSSSSNHRRQFVGLPSRKHQLQRQWRGSEFSPAEARRDEAVIAAAAAESSSWPAGAGTSSSSRGRNNATRASASSSAATASMPSLSSSSASSSTSRGRELLDAIADLPWQRVAVWAVVAWAAYQLKDFFGIFMGTFVVSFVGNGIVRSAQSTRLFSRLVKGTRLRRRVLVAGYFSLIVAACALFGVMTIPDIVREGADFVQRLKSDSIWVVVLEKVRAGVGDGLMDQVERFLLVAAGESEAVVKAGGKTASALLSYSSGSAWTAERTAVLGNVLAKMLRSYTDTAVALTSAIVSSVSRFAAQVAVSLVLSFVVVWDLPTIAAGFRSLETSRLSPIYKEVAPSVAVFGQLFGKALQAQARIALVNTALTAAGLVALAIPGVGLLSLFVFLCSFIPIAGCFISTVPIAFVALTEYGFLKLALVILMVACIHVIEAYGLNPAIYSAHLKLHPLLVLTVLVVAEHSLGVWGLLLAVPLTVFVLDYAIRYPACSVIDVAERELQTIGEGSDEDEEGGSGGGGEGAKPGGGSGGGGGSGSGGNSGSSSSSRPLGPPPLGQGAPPPAWGSR